MTERVEVVPGASILTVLQHLNYEPWFALAEYVDNAVQSFQNNRHQLGNQDVLEVKISINRSSKEILIEDNAAGIADEDLQRACKTAEIPPDRTGLHEFGMGMKSASFWFTKKWDLTTKAVGEPHQKRVAFDLDEIAVGGKTSIGVTRTPMSTEAHGTTIRLREVEELCQGQTLGKIRRHLADIYRQLILERTLSLSIGVEGQEEELKVIPHESLFSKTFKRNKEVEGTDKVVWAKDIQIELNNGKRAFGRAGVLAKGSGDNGVTLFRRGRAILGTGESKWKPYEIYKHNTSYIRQRLWIELNIDGFQVSHTKDGIKWGDSEEDEFINNLKDQLEKEPLNLIAQCENYRKRTAEKQDNSQKPNSHPFEQAKAEKIAIESATTGALDAFESGISSEENTTEDIQPQTHKKSSLKKTDEREFVHEDRTWKVKLNLIDESRPFMYQITTQLGQPNNLVVEADVFIGSPFFEREVQIHVPESLGPAMCFIGALVSAEAEAALQSVNSVSYVRRHINKAMNK